MRLAWSNDAQPSAPVLDKVRLGALSIVTGWGTDCDVRVTGGHRL